jgi:hypothetical protein
MRRPADTMRSKKRWMATGKGIRSNGLLRLLAIPSLSCRI